LTRKLRTLNQRAKMFHPPEKKKKRKEIKKQKRL